MDVTIIEIPDLGCLFLTLAALIILDLSVNVIKCPLDNPNDFLHFFPKLFIRFQKLLADFCPLAFKGIHKLIKPGPVRLGLLDCIIRIYRYCIAVSGGHNLCLQFLIVPFDFLDKPVILRVVYLQFHIASYSSKTTPISDRNS